MERFNNKTKKMQARVPVALADTDDREVLGCHVLFDFESDSRYLPKQKVFKM
jgi:hypothetical protein